LTCARAPFDNPAVRRAFALAIDRKTIVEKITLAGEEPAMAIVPPAILEPHSGQPFRARAQAFFADNDIAAAQAALAEAGYPGGRGFPRTRYMYNTSEQHKIIAEALQQMWARGLGVEVELENQEWKTYLDNRNQGNFDMTRAAWIGDIPDPINFLDLFITGGGNNNQNYSNPQFDALIRQSKQEPDSARRFDLLGEAEALAMSEFPIAPIYYYAMPYLENPRVKGIVRNGLGWLDLTFALVEGSNAAAAPGNP